MNWVKTIAAASCAAIIGSAASAATVVNGSFEDGPDLIGSWDIINGPTPIDGWNADPNIEIQTQATLGLTPQDGLRYAELDTNVNARIYQKIVLDAGTYLLSFFYSPRVNDTSDDADTNDMSYSVADLSGSVLGAPTPGEFNHGEWTEVTGYFTVAADGTEVELSFQASGETPTSGCGNCGALLDNVSIAAVPLPAGLLLMLSAVGAFGFARRRTQA